MLSNDYWPDHIWTAESHNGSFNPSGRIAEDWKLVIWEELLASLSKQLDYELRVLFFLFLFFLFFFGGGSLTLLLFQLILWYLHAALKTKEEKNSSAVLSMIVWSRKEKKKPKYLLWSNLFDLKNSSMIFWNNNLVHESNFQEGQWEQFQYLHTVQLTQFKTFSSKQHARSFPNHSAVVGSRLQPALIN